MNENKAKNAVKFIWHAKITKDYFEKDSLNNIYDWLLNIAKTDCKEMGYEIKDNKIDVSFDFPLDGDFIFITVTQDVLY